MPTYRFINDFELNSVHLYTINKHKTPKIFAMISTNKKLWELDLSASEEVDKYVYIVDESFWICDYTKNITKIDQYCYSDPHSNLPLQKTPPQVIKAFFCKDFHEEDLSPLDITDQFTNLNSTIGFWSEIRDVQNNLIIYMQLYDAENQLVLMTHEKLTAKSNGSTNIFYFAFQITPNLIPGNWKVRLIYDGKCLLEKKFRYYIIQNNYYKSTVYKNSSVILDRKL